MRLKASGIDLDVVMDVVSAHFGVDPAELSSPSRRRQISQARGWTWGPGVAHGKFLIIQR
jgi:chromosomal replication initiation ATPase DnaA